MIFDFQQKKNMRRLFYSPVVVGIVAMIALYALYSTWSIYRKLIETQKEADMAQQKVLVLESRNAKLDSDIQTLQTSAGVEKEIRGKFGVAKPGEAEAVIVDSPVLATTTKTSSHAWWTRFYHWLGF